MKTQFLIGAANSGSGKTTFTVGLLRVLQKRKIGVQAYKCGPDYIDTYYHRVASGTVSVNLDTWLASEQHVRSVYAHYAEKVSCCVVEGVMGLFDGYHKMQGSSASMAVLLKIPVVLVVNAASSAYSVAPLIYGFCHFNPEVRIAGVVFNRVSSESHFKFLKDACDDLGVECFGYLPKSPDIVIPSRHLGLVLDGDSEAERYISAIASLVEQHVDVDRMLECCKCPLIPCTGLGAEPVSAQGPLTIAVARDEAFNFIYRVNLERLEQLGQVVFFSPLHDSVLPAADIVYLPGGYPELYAGELAQNRSMKEQLRHFAGCGGRIFAECGGMIYLGKSLECEGRLWEMAGVLPVESTMEGARLTLGYRSMEWKGRVWKGHEFHYSRTLHPEVLPSLGVQHNARGGLTPVPLYRKGNVIAGYTHWYWGENDFLDFWNIE